LAVGSGFTDDGEVMDQEARMVGAYLLTELLSSDRFRPSFTAEETFELCVEAVKTPDGLDGVAELLGVSTEAEARYRAQAVAHVQKHFESAELILADRLAMDHFIARFRKQDKAVG